MSFPFSATIPAAQNAPALDQPTMQLNNASTAAALAVNHVGFNDALCGQHKLINFSANQGSDPAVNVVSVLYPKLDSNSVSQLFFRNPSGVSQLTGTPANSGTNWAYKTPFGFYVAWGQDANTSSPLNITLPGGLSFSNTSYSVQTAFLGIPARSSLTVTITGNNTFSISWTGGNAGISYFAIGI